MPESQDLQHRYYPNTAFPYWPNDSPTDKREAWVAGSNILTSQKGYSERRNGFAAWISDSSTFTFSGTLQRFYTWRRWTGAAVTLSGQYFVMYNDTSATTSRVWKQRVGTDVYPVLIHTDTTSTGVFDFTLSNNFIFFGNGVDMKKYDGTTVTNWGITGPSAAVTFSSGSGSLSPVIGYKWQIAWENSSTGHISSPSTASASSGSGSSVKFTFTGNTTSDAQVDKVRLFRTVDGGSIFFELPASPIAYATWTVSGYEDNTADSALTSSVAPLVNQNNRPTASFDPVWFANRIWTHANDTLTYSDFEELVRGVEEEAFASTNTRFMGREIIAKRVAGEYLLIMSADVIWRIYGDTLATFRLDTLANGKGCLNRAAAIAFEGLVAWLDSSSTVWVTDGTPAGMKEISYPIRTDIASINHATAALAYHSTGNARWLILMDGTGGKLYVFDLDTQQWMPPWPIEGITAIYSGQTALATYRLFLGRTGKPLRQDTNYQDDGANYTASATAHLMDIVPPDNPSQYGVVDHIEVETGTAVPASVKFLTDEDPDSGTYIATDSSGNNPPNRTQGTSLVETWYPTISDPNMKGARRVSIQYNWAAANSTFKMYGTAIAYKVVDE